MEIRALNYDDAERCDEIVRSLPWHFAQDEGQRQCAIAVRNQRGFVVEVAGVVVGFVTYQRHFESAGEITWLAVHADHRRKGMGRQLLHHGHAVLHGEGLKLMTVLTVSPGEPDDRADGYGATVRFYQSCGYELTREFVDLWPGSRAVLMTRWLD